MRFLFERHVAARVAFVLLLDHVVSLVFVESGDGREGLAADVASQPSVRVALAHSLLGMTRFDMTQQNRSRVKVGFFTDVTSEQLKSRVR